MRKLLVSIRRFLSELRYRNVYKVDAPFRGRGFVALEETYDTRRCFLRSPQE